MREQITKIEPQPVITRDNVTMEVDAVIYFLIVDPVRATYEVQNLRVGPRADDAVGAAQRHRPARSRSHAVLARQHQHAAARRASISATQQWGVKVMRIELKNINPPEEIRLTMEKQMTAERTRRAVVTTAEGEKSSAILRAEGQKQSQIVNAEGAKQAAILAAEGQARGAAARGAGRSAGDSDGGPGHRDGGQPGAVPDRAALSRVARRRSPTNAQKLVFLPYEASGIMASLGGIRELLKAEPAK